MRTAAPFPILRILAAVACLLATDSGTFAESPRVKVTGARIGLPPGGRATDRDEGGTPLHLAKFAAWAPVYVDLQVLEPVEGPIELVIETPDADEVTTSLAVPLNLVGMSPGTTVAAWTAGPMPYLRPGGGMSETTVFVRSTSGAALSEPFRLRFLRSRDPLTYVVLSLGNRLPGFDLPKPASGKQDQAQQGDPTALRNGRVDLAAITEIEQLPDQWFGYDAADLVVLTTSSADFLDRLFGGKGSAADRVKRGALLEWVRRGGRVVVSVGANAGLVAQFTQPDATGRRPELYQLLPAVADPTPRTVTTLPLTFADRESGLRGVISHTLTAKGGPLSVANLTPKPLPGRVVIPATGGKADGSDVVAVQAAFGLGRATVIGFDLDRPPFTEFPNRAEFWDWVLREGGAARASVGQETRTRTASATPSDEEDEAIAALRTHIDTFDGVPVISFGWVAVFIGLYILLIGPIEYYFLKRVLGRLELTWVTFPIIVVTVSTATYFTAYAVKGRDLKVNKVDVIEVVAEVDPETGQSRGGRVYGSTWFTVFSPRIDTYTIGVTPAEGWAASGDQGNATLGWVGGPRAGRASLVRRRYSYHVDGAAVADGLMDVPVQVWSTKSFTANWAAEMDPARPAIESRLSHPPGNRDLVVGTFVNRMPFPEIHDCVAFYAGKAYPLGTILANTEVRLVLEKGREAGASDWLQREGQLASVLARVPTADPGPGRTRSASGSQPTTTAGGHFPLWGVLFHEASLRHDESGYPRNSSLRRLDQSWRLTPANRSEVILVGRVLPPSGLPAKELFSGSQSPTRLWLKGLPRPGETAPEVPGTARQEAYVRVYLPVLPAGRAR